MLNRHKHSWSHNELFAHKKNVGEQAKFRDTMFRLEKKFGLVKDSIRHEATQVRTSLKCLRKSTGHSIDALPPTPFQLNYVRENTFVTFADPISDSELEKHNPEFDYLMDEINSQPQEDVSNKVNDVIDDNDDMVSSCETCVVRQSSKQESINSDAYTSRHKMMYNFRKREISSFDTPKRSNSPMLPEIKPVDNVNLVTVRQGNSYDTNRLEITTEIGTDAKAKESKYVREVERVDPLIKNNSLNEYGHLNKQTSFSEDTKDKSEDQTDNIFLKSKENTTMTHYSESDLQTTTWSSPTLSRLPTNFYNSENRPRDSAILKRRREKQRERNRMSSEDQEISQLRNTRTRCRTCLERYRQNVEFQKQKKLLEQEQQDRLKSAAAGKNQGLKLTPMVEKSFLATDNDLHSLFAESQVLDFEDSSTCMARHRKNTPAYKRGFSKARLQQLAEPKKGRRKKMLFSKQLIKKEVDDLTERHSQPMLTEKEKERIRMLESKIRMFLAVTSASGDVMPSGMVHIPQREDVMRVDISHLK